MSAPDPRDYDTWRRLLAGERAPVHEDEPICGFFRVRDGQGGPFVPAAIWKHEGKLVAMKAGRFVPVAELWPWAARHVVGHLAYTHAAQTGEWLKNLKE